ncbi:MAG: putative inorganic carbon transporter subunit DabA, partial [Bdellovibrio sp.]
MEDLLKGNKPLEKSTDKPSTSWTGLGDIDAFTGDPHKWVNREKVLASFKEAAQKLSPLWGIRDYVAVNPFFGFRDHHFIDFLRYLQSASGKSLLPKKDFFRKKFEMGEITESDLETAARQYPGDLDRPSLSIEDLVKYLSSPDRELEESQFKCVSDFADLESGSSFGVQITNEISNWASAYFDETQALWKAPRRDLRFFAWWKSLVIWDRSYESHNSNLHQLVKSLPVDPEEALQDLVVHLTNRFQLRAKDLSNYFYRLIYSSLGWASYFQRFEFEAARSGDATQLKRIGGLLDLLVVRMTYDLSLGGSAGKALMQSFASDPLHPLDLKKAYIWLMAAESAYRRSLLRAIQTRKQMPGSQSLDSVADVQMVFCIDVRSEVLRRHLELLSPRIQTLGFAGFFGMPMAIQGLGHQQADHQCPVLLNSTFTVMEKEATGGAAALLPKKLRYIQTQYLKRSIQQSANSGFAFVETLGLSYIGKMLSSCLGYRKPN